MLIFVRLFHCGYINLSISIKIEKKERTRGQHLQDLPQQDADKPKKEWKHLGIGKKSSKKP
jgi:hypothetical protein